MADGFTDVAGGSYRKKNGERMRFKVLHKVLDYKPRNGYHMCVGCGECVINCPSAPGGKNTSAILSTAPVLRNPSASAEGHGFACQGGGQFSYVLEGQQI